MAACFACERMWEYCWSSVIVWAGDSDRGEVKTVAEHIVNQMLKQRPIWVPSPINR